jgi:hypothetical protein
MFAEFFTASEDQCVTILESIPFSVAACAEPLGVTLHAVARAGAILDRKVLVTGSGPIGVLVPRRIPMGSRRTGSGEDRYRPILSGEFSLADAISAFELASDRSKAMKVSFVATA